MTGIGETPPAPSLAPVENRGRGPSARVALGLVTAALVALVGISLVGQSGGRPGQQAAGGGPTASPVAAASQAPSATPLVSSSSPQPAQAPSASPTAPPSGASGAVHVTSGTVSGWGFACAGEAGSSYCLYTADIVASDDRLSGCYILLPTGSSAAATWGTFTVYRDTNCGFGFRLPKDKVVWDGEWFTAGSRAAVFLRGGDDAIYPVDTIWVRGRGENEGLSAVLRIWGDGTGDSFRPHVEGWIFPTQLPPSAANTVPGAVSPAQTPRPAPTPAATWREMPSTQEVIAAAELADPTGDVSWRLESGPATQPPGTPNIDVSRIVGWIAGETLYAEVTLEGQMPKAPDRIPALRLRVGVGSRFAFEAPIVCRPLCERWGTFFEVPAFTYRVKQLSSQWVATFAVDLASLGTTGTSEYRIGVSAEAYPGDYASDWYDETDPLVVKRSF
jgi:hypothetical protein